VRLMVTFEARLIKTKNGNIYSRGGPVSLNGYLQVFDEVVVFARMEEVAQEKLDRFRLDGPNIKFFPLVYYVGPWQFLRQHRKLDDLAKQALHQADAFILRVPSAIGQILYRQLMKDKIPYGVEVVGDPLDVFAPGSVKTPLRPFVRRVMSRNLVKQCRHASAASYVTKYALQKRYPPGGWSTHYSSIELPAEAIVDKSVIDERMKKLEGKTKSGTALRICYVGTMAQLYKGQDILIKAFASCVNKGMNSELIMIGDGRYRPQLEKLTRQLSIAERVQFPGRLSREEVFNELDKADLYVLPSHTEGLPRSVIEAMARALPCIASNVGGIPELLDAEDMVQPGNAEVLATKIESVISDRTKLKIMARRNLETAHKYCKDKLEQHRRIFYEKLREITKSKRLPM